MIDPNDTLATLQSLMLNLDVQIAELGVWAEDRRNQIHALARAVDSSGQWNPETFAAFMRRPWTLLPAGKDAHYLIVPKFVGLRAGIPIRADDEYLVFRVSRFAHFLNPLPDWLADQLGYDQPDYAAHLVREKGIKTHLLVTAGDPTEVYTKLGGKDRFSSKSGNKLYIKQKSEFDVLRDLVLEGIMPYQPNPVLTEHLRTKPATTITLRPKQLRDFNRFRELGAATVIADTGAGKTFFALYAGGSLRGKKLVIVPSKILADQWRSRIRRYCLSSNHEWHVRTYQSLASKMPTDKYALVIKDEAHHLPSDMGLRTFRVKAQYTLALTATPYREDKYEAGIIVLGGYPIGQDWETSSTPKVTVWVVRNEAARFDLVEQLLQKPVDGKQLVFVHKLDYGRKLADHLGLEFISGETHKQLERVRMLDAFVISSVGDQGMSLDDVGMVIEANWLGGRTQTKQRAGRAMHGTNGSQVHFVLTKGEWDAKRNQKRLSVLYQPGIEVDTRFLV